MRKANALVGCDGYGRDPKEGGPRQLRARHTLYTGRKEGTDMKVWRNRKEASALNLEDSYTLQPRWEVPNPY